MPQTLLDSSLDQHVVLRPFPGPGARMLQRGEVVETRDWRNVQPLLNGRYLAPMFSPEGRAAAKAPEYGRAFKSALEEMLAGVEADLVAAELAEVKRIEAEKLAAEAAANAEPKRGPGRPRKEAA